MVLGWDLQNSRDWLVVAIHQKSYHVGNLPPGEPKTKQNRHQQGSNFYTSVLHDFHNASRLFLPFFLSQIN